MTEAGWDPTGPHWFETDEDRAAYEREKGVALKREDWNPDFVWLDARMFEPASTKPSLSKEQMLYGGSLGQITFDMPPMTAQTERERQLMQCIEAWQARCRELERERDEAAEAVRAECAKIARDHAEYCQQIAEERDSAELHARAVGARHIAEKISA